MANLFHDPALLAQYALVGGVAATIGAAVKDRRLQLPRVTVEKESDGTTRTYLDPGFIATGLGGGLLAAIMDQSLQNAAAWGLATAFVGKEIFQPIIAAFAKGLGTSVTFEHGGVAQVQPATVAPREDR
jgi:hypothetical protein